MNVLIVDDNATNRLTIKLYLEEYAEAKGLKAFKIDEAEDGLIALKLCQKNFYNIIFMDIMMPNMDGIESTQRIKEMNDLVMIIAISGLEDGDKKSVMLNIGAEDYISKPINGDIFMSRINNYVALAESRMHTRYSSQNINLYTVEVYNRNTKFFLNSEDAQAEFWEFFLLNARQKSDKLSDIVRAIISIVETQKNISKSVVYVEESEEKQYFTLVGIHSLPTKVIKLLLLKNGIRSSYIFKKDRLSFELSKLEESEDEITKTNITTQQEPIKIEEKKIEEEIVTQNFTSSKALEVFHYLEDEDLYDLEEYVNNLNSLMLIVGNGDITHEEVEEMFSYLEKIASILSTYSEVYDISKALVVLSTDMSTHIEEFIKNSEALGPLCKAFSNDISNWVEQTFHTGAPSVNFMNDTIVVNCQTIGGMLKMNDAVAESDDFDDIFDF